MVVVDKVKLKEVLQPYLSKSGGIKYMRHIDMFLKLMSMYCEDKNSRAIYCEVLKATDRTILEIFLVGADELLLKWVRKCLDNKETIALQKLLKFFQELPIDSKFLENSKIFQKLKELRRQPNFEFAHAVKSILHKWNSKIKVEKINAFKIPKKSEPAKDKPIKTEGLEIEDNSLAIDFDGNKSKSPMEKIYQEEYPKWSEHKTAKPQLSQAPKIEELEIVEKQFINEDVSYVESAEKAAQKGSLSMTSILKVNKMDDSIENKPRTRRLTFAPKEVTVKYFEKVPGERFNVIRPENKSIQDNEWEGHNYFDTIIQIPWKDPPLIDIPEDTFNKKFAYQMNSTNSLQQDQISTIDPIDDETINAAEPVNIPLESLDEFVYDYSNESGYPEDFKTDELIEHPEVMILFSGGEYEKEFSYVDYIIPTKNNKNKKLRKKKTGKFERYKRFDNAFKKSKNFNRSKPYNKFQNASNSFTCNMPDNGPKNSEENYQNNQNRNFVTKMEFPQRPQQNQTNGFNANPIPRPQQNSNSYQNRGNFRHNNGNLKSRGEANNNQNNFYKMNDIPPLMPPQNMRQCDSQINYVNMNQMPHFSNDDSYNFYQGPQSFQQEKQMSMHNRQNPANRFKKGKNNRRQNYHPYMRNMKERGTKTFEASQVVQNC